MTINDIEDPSPQPPRLWKYLLGVFVTLLILIPAWTLLLALVIRPEFLMEPTLRVKHFLVFVLLPVTVVALVFLWRWKAAEDTAVQARAASQRARQEVAKALTEQQRREYVLEVISLGVTLDRYRQGALWEALKRGHPQASIREQDPKKYAWSEDEKNGQEGGRQGHTLENGIKFTVMYWGIPAFSAMPPVFNESYADKPNEPNLGFVGSTVASGLAWHLVLAGPRRHDEHPDRLLQDVFDFLDANPEVPYVVLSANDGMGTRNEHRPKGSPRLLRDGHYIPEMPDSSVLLVLARRERVDATRADVWDEPFDEGRTRQLFEFYVDVKQSVPRPPGLPQRQPTIAEWLAATPKFAQREDIYPKGFSALAGDLNPFAAGHPPKDYKPTPWFPLPWNKDQLAMFDKLPTLGFIHRPVFVPTVDDKGQPLTRPQERAAALAAGWQQALQTLPEAGRKAAPARVVSATGGNVAQTIALSSVLNDWTEHGGPALDAAKPTERIDTDARLGNTGAATWFMQMAIGVMGSYREGGVTAAVNLRDAKEASIVLISPPPEDKRKNQQHPEGGDVFRHHSAPAVDPANYTPP